MNPTNESPDIEKRARLKMDVGRRRERRPPSSPPRHHAALTRPKNKSLSVITRLPAARERPTALLRDGVLQGAPHGLGRFRITFKDGGQIVLGLVKGYMGRKSEHARIDHCVDDEGPVR